MRISDWSSDVCSSDLDQVHRVAKGLGNRYHPAVVGAVEVGETVQAAAGEEALAGAGRIVSLHGGGEQLRQILAGIFKQGAGEPRSEERRVGQECGSTCRSRGEPYH